MAFESSRLLDVKSRKVAIAGRDFKLSNGRRCLIDTLRAHSFGLLQIGEILTLDPLVFGVMLTHRLELLGK